MGLGLLVKERIYKASVKQILSMFVMKYLLEIAKLSRQLVVMLAAGDVGT